MAQAATHTISPVPSAPIEQPLRLHMWLDRVPDEMREKDKECGLSDPPHWRFNKKFTAKDNVMDTRWLAEFVYDESFSLDSELVGPLPSQTSATLLHHMLHNKRGGMLALITAPPFVYEGYGIAIELWSFNRALRTTSVRVPRDSSALHDGAAAACDTGREPCSTVEDAGLRGVEAASGRVVGCPLGRSPSKIGFRIQSIAGAWRH